MKISLSPESKIIYPKPIFGSLVRARDGKLEEEYNRDPEKWQEKYGKFLIAYFLGMEPKGFGLFEFDKPEQMINMERVYWPL